MLCSWCEGDIKRGWSFVQIGASLKGRNYILNYHTWCDTNCHTNPPKGWDDCLKEKA